MRTVIALYLLSMSISRKAFAIRFPALSIGIFSTPLPAAGKGSCSGVIRLIQKYDDRDGVEAVNLGGFLLGIAKIAASGEEGSEWLDYLDRMAVFTAEDASEETKAEFAAELMAVLGEYEKAAEMKDGTDDMSIWMKMKSRRKFWTIFPKCSLFQTST